MSFKNNLKNVSVGVKFLASTSITGFVPDWVGCREIKFGVLISLSASSSTVSTKTVSTKLVVDKLDAVAVSSTSNLSFLVSFFHLYFFFDGGCNADTSGKSAADDLSCHKQDMEWGGWMWGVHHYFAEGFHLPLNLYFLHLFPLSNPFVL